MKLLSFLICRCALPAFTVVLLTLTLSQAAWTQTSVFTYQGRLADGSSAANGTYDFQFALYDAVTGGLQQPQPSPVTATLPGVTVTNGVFTVQLDFGIAAFTGADRFLEISVKRNSDTTYATLSPRQQLTSTPYSMRSLSANTADNAANFSGSLSGDVTGTQGSTVVGKLQGRPIAGTAPANGQVLKFNGTQWSPASDTDTNTTYTAGSGLSLSGTTLSANFGGDGSAVTVSRSDHGHNGATWTCSTPDCKTLQLFTNDTGVNSTALLGKVNSTSGQGTGIWGVTASTDPSSAAVFGQANAGAAKAVWGDANGATGIAIYGRGFNGAKAAQFEGNVSVLGTLSKSGGSFKIDHPTDPENKYLSHSFVESPDMKNIYDGNVVTDANGDATVTMPAWFEALNRDFRYQLTVIGEFAQAIVADEIKNNRFRIKTDKPNVKVSWQVTGIRHDKFADDNRIPVEEDKPLDEKGKCLYAPACKSKAAMPQTNLRRDTSKASPMVHRKISPSGYRNLTK